MILLLASAVLCLVDEPSAQAAPAPAPAPAPVAAGALEPEPDWRRLGRSLWFDPRQKQLVIKARVALREGPLEHLLCLKGTKEHEAILATDDLPRQIHAGLILTGAEPGHPVRFLPKFSPPTGSPIAIELQWNDLGKTQSADARRWIRDERKKAPLTT